MKCTRSASLINGIGGFGRNTHRNNTCYGLRSYASAATKETVHLIDATPWIFKCYLSVPVNMTGPGDMCIYSPLQYKFIICDYWGTCKISCRTQTEPEGATYRCAISGNSRDIKKCISFPKELREQLPKISEIVSKGFNIPVIQHKEYDADAVIHKYAQEAVAKHHPVTLVTEDLRLFQLLSHKSQVTAWTPRKAAKLGNFLDEDEVLTRYGVPPHLLRDLHVLIGNSRFELPGVEGFKGTHAHTQKVTTSFLNMYGSLENLIANLKELKEKSPQFYEYIAPNADLIKDGLNKYTLTPAPVPVDIASLHYDKLNTEFLIKRLKEYDFKSVLKKLPVLGIPEALVST